MQEVASLGNNGRLPKAMQPPRLEAVCLRYCLHSHRTFVRDTFSVRKCNPDVVLFTYAWHALVSDIPGLLAMPWKLERQQASQLADCILRSERSTRGELLSWLDHDILSCRPVLVRPELLRKHFVLLVFRALNECVPHTQQFRFHFDKIRCFYRAVRR